jgi:Ca2+-binding RTX toxin-like protein
MSTPTSTTPFVGPELEQLMLALGNSWLDDGYWRPLPGVALDTAQLVDGLALVLNAPAPVVAGAVYIGHSATGDGALHLTAAAWHTLMLQWLVDDAAGLASIARGAPAIGQGASVVSLSLSATEWVALLPRVEHALGMAAGQYVPTLLDGTPPEQIDVASLHAAIAEARNDSGLVIAERTPLDEDNRYARFAVAVNQLPGSSDQSVLLSRAMLESLRAIWPAAVDLAEADILGGANPIGVVRLGSAARGGLSVADWTAALVQRGAIHAGQVVHTAFGGDPASLADFNAAVRRDAFPSSFHTPSPSTVSMGDTRRNSVLAAALALAGGQVQQAAAWLDLGRQALEDGVVQDGWIALDAQTADLLNPALWPARNPVLLDALRLGGQVRQTVAGLALSGRLDRALASGETLSVVVGNTVYSSAPGGGLSITGDSWALTLADDASDSWRDVVVSRSLGNTSEVLQRFDLLDQQGGDSLMVQAAALGRWYGQGSADLGQAVASLLQAAAAGTSDRHGLELVNVTALQGLLFDPELQRVLASQGFTLPAAAVAFATPPTDNAARIGAQGRLLDVSGALQATRETLLAWAAQAGSLGGYGAVPPRTGAQAGVLPPVQQLGATVRAALTAGLAAARGAVDSQAMAARTAVPVSAAVHLGVNLPAGSTYTVEVSSDDGATWTPAPSLQAALGSGRTLVRVSDVVLLGGATTDTALTLTASRTANASVQASASTQLFDPTRPRLMVDALSGGAREDDGHAVFRLRLSRALPNDLALALALEHVGTDGSDIGTGFEISRDDGGTWTALGGASTSLLAGETALLVRHAVLADSAAEGAESWRLNVSASGTGADTLASASVSATAVLTDVGLQALSVLTRDVGQGEGELGFEVRLARTTRQALTLQLTLGADAALDLSAHEVSFDGGHHWQVLAFNAQHQATVTLQPGDAAMQLRSRVAGLSGSAATAAVGLAVADITAQATPLAGANASAQVWRHGSTPQVWVEDLVIDAASGDATFTVRLSGPSALPVTVDYATAMPASGAADPLRDFFESSGRITFGVGETVQQVQVNLRQGWDERIDARHFELQLSNPVHATLGDPLASASLLGEAPRVVVSGAQADEAGTGFALFQVGLSHAHSTATTLLIEVQGDEADGDDDVGALQVYDTTTSTWVDYVAASGVQLAAGQTQLLVRAALNPRAAGALETDEHLTLRVNVDSSSAAGLARASASAALVLLGDADAPRVVARSGGTAFGGEGAVFELSAGGADWVSLASTDLAQITSAWGQAGLDPAFIEQARRYRPDAQGSLVPVYDAAALERFRQVLQQHAAATDLRLQLDTVVGWNASATSSTTQLGGATALDIGAKDADFTARLKALGEVVLPLHIDPVAGAQDSLGAVVTAVVGNQEHYLVSQATLAHWSASLQRSQQRAAALDQRQRLALLSDGDPAVAVALGSTQADGSGSADRWLAELGQAGVMLLDVSADAYDPEAIGGIYRRRDADGTERLYVSQDTLTVWSEQLANQAAFATSRFNGGLADYGETYLRDKATFDANFPMRYPDLGKARVAYAAATLVRNVFWFQKDMDIERIHHVNNQFYRRLSGIKVMGTAIDGVKSGALSLNEALVALETQYTLMEQTPGWVSNRLPFKAFADSFRNMDMHSPDAQAAGEAFAQMELTYQDLVNAHGDALNAKSVQSLKDKADYQEFLKEGEQVTRLTFALLAITTVLPATYFSWQAQRDEGNDLGAAYAAMMGTQVFLQALHMPWWFATGALDAHLNAKQLVARNEELIRRTLRAYGGGENLWDAFVADRGLRLHMGKEKLLLDEVEVDENGPGTVPDERAVVLQIDGQNRRVVLSRQEAGHDFSGVDLQGRVYTLSGDEAEGFELNRLHDGQTEIIDSADFRLELRNKGWGYFETTDGQVLLLEGTPVSEELLGIWKRLDPRLRVRFSQDALVMLSDVTAMTVPTRNDKGDIVPGVTDTFEGELHELLDRIDPYTVSHFDSVDAVQANLVKDLSEGVTFRWTSEADAHNLAMTRAFDHIKGLAPVADKTGAQAYTLATGENSFRVTVDPSGRFTLRIDAVGKPKAIMQDLQTAFRELEAMYVSTGERWGNKLSALLASPEPVGDVVVNLDEINAAGEKPIPARVLSAKELRMERLPADEPRARREIAQNDAPLLDLIPKARLLNLLEESRKDVSAAGAVTEAGYRWRREAVDAQGRPTGESGRLVAQYTGEAGVFLGRYTSLLASDMLGIATASVGIVIAAQQLADVEADDPNGEREETRRLKAQWIGEIAKQSMFLAGYATLTTGHILMAVTELPVTTRAAKLLYGIDHGLSVLTSMVGSAMVLGSEVVNSGTYFKRWHDAALDGRDPSHEERWGALGSLGNSAYLALEIALSVKVPALAIPLGVLSMFMPNWAAIGAGLDIEQNQVGALRKAGRDAEADMAETLAVASMRAGIPIYGLFSTLFTPKMANYQVKTGSPMYNLLHDGDALSADKALEHLVAQTGGAPETTTSSRAVNRYAVPAALYGETDLIVPLNEYLVGNGSEVGWNLPAAIDENYSHLSQAERDAYAKMIQASARLMRERMAAQAVDGGRDWFKTAFDERIAASIRVWEDAESIAAASAAQLAGEAVALRAQAASDRDAQLMLDSHDHLTVTAYDMYKQTADATGARFSSTHLRVVGYDIYDGNERLGNYQTWLAQASQQVDQSVMRQGVLVTPRTLRAERYQASLILAYFKEIYVYTDIERRVAALDLTDPDFGLAQVDRLIGMLKGTPQTSDVFLLASRSESFEYSHTMYARTMAYSNYSTHATDQLHSNVEWVDGSYLMKVGRPQPGADDTVAWWGGWNELARPTAPELPAEGASAELVQAYNQAVQAYNTAAFAYNAHLKTYLDAILTRSPEERGSDPAVPPLPLRALAGMAPGAGASAAQLQAHADALQSQTDTDTQHDTVNATRRTVLQARYQRVQNETDADDHATTAQRYGLSGALDAVGYRLDTQVTGHDPNSVAEHWVIGHNDITRDANGEAVGSEARFFVRNENGNTLRTMAIDSSALDDVDQVFSVERRNVTLKTGDGDDTFLLTTTEGIDIDSGAGVHDQALLLHATAGQTIDLDRFKGVVTVMGSSYSDTVRSSDNANHHYIDQSGLLEGTPGEAGDDVQLTGPGSHLVEIRSGRVLTGVGDDMVVVREHMGGVLEIDLGAGDNLVSFASLPGVRLVRDTGTGDYSFRHITWILANGAVPDTSVGSLGWGLAGTLRNVQQVAGSAMGDSFELDGGIHSLQANGGDDRIVLRGGDVVADGGSGDDEVQVHGAHNTRVLMEDAGDRVVLASTVQDAMVLVGAMAGVEGAADGPNVKRGLIDASATAGRVVVDVVDGVVEVKVGTGHTVINLATASARVVIQDHTGRVAAGGTIEFNLLPGAPLDDLALRTHLAESHATVEGATPASSLLNDKVVFKIPAGPNHAYQGVSLKATDLQGQPVVIDLAQALPDVAGEPVTSPLQVHEGGPVLRAWAGVRTVIDLQPGDRVSGAYSPADAQARGVALQAQQTAALQQQAQAAAARVSVRGLLADTQAGSALQGWRDAIDMNDTTLLQTWVAGGAEIGRFVLNAGDLVPGVGAAAAALPALGWSAVQVGELDGALAGRAAYSARLDTLVASQATVAVWRGALADHRQNWLGNSGMQATLDALDAQLAAVPTSGASAGQLHWVKSFAVKLLVDLAVLGILTPAQSQIVTGIERGGSGALTVHSLAAHADLSWADPGLQGLGVPGAQTSAQVGSENWVVRYGAANPSLVLYNSGAGTWSTSRQSLLQWSTDLTNVGDRAQAVVDSTTRALADLAPYRLSLAAGQALPTGMVNDTVHNTLELNSATPLQRALELRARNGDDTAFTQLWLQVDRFEGVTRVGTDGMDIMVASGPHANLLAGGRGIDQYTVRDDNDIVFENADEGDDHLIGLGTSHTLNDNVERLGLDYAGAAGAVLHGTGNALDNQLYGNRNFANVLNGREGADHMYGGLLDDVYHVDHQGDSVNEYLGGGVDWVYSAIDYSLVQGDWLLGQVENLRLLGDGDRSGTGNALANRIEGNSGDNLLDGGAGVDTMVGGLGNDTYVVDNAADQVIENAGEGVDTVRASLSWTLGAQLENLVLTGNAHINGTGNAADNQLRGNAGKNRIDGGAGTDTAVLSGQLADYTFLYTSTGEWAVGDKVAGRDNVDRWSAIESVRFEASGQTLTLAQLMQLGQQGGADVHLARAYVASHADLSLASPSSETAGLDHYFNYGYAEGRQIGFDPWQYMAAHLDVAAQYNLDANTAAWHYINFGRAEGRVATLNMAVQHIDVAAESLYGQAGQNDALFGNLGDNRLYGLDGNDALFGGLGGDVLDGGTGADRMAGGAGDDLYLVDSTGDVVLELASQGTDTVIGFVSYTLPTNVENGQFAGEADINLTGNGLDNVLRGNSGSNLLTGGAGTDTVLLDAPLSAFQFMRLSNGEVVMGHRDPALGRADRLVGIERLQIFTTGDVIDLATLAMPTLLAYTASLSPAVINTLGIDEAAAVQHYINVGQPAGQTVTFDALRYMASNVDVPAVLGFSEYQAAKHYIQYGRNDGHAAPDPSLVLQIAGNTDTTLNGLNDQNDGLFGGNGNDHLYGGSGSDGLFGGAGNDLLDGGAGADRMAGGAGDDTYIVDLAGDLVYESLFGAQGTDTVISFITYTLPTQVENGQLSYSGPSIDLTGNSAHNVLQGNGSNNLLTGLGGNDTLYGDAGSDTLNGGDDNDVLDGGTGADAMAGGTGDDTYFVDDAGDVVTEYFSQGTDTVKYTGADGTGYTLAQPLDNLELLGTAHTNATGNAWDNVLTGNTGNNVLVGDTGNDTLIGNAGNDELRGGTGSDTYRFARGDGQDVIKESNSDPASADRLEFQLTGLGAVSYDQLWFSTQDGYSVTAMVMGTNDSVKLDMAFVGAAMESITAADLNTSDPSDLRTLSASGLSQLLDAMSGMTPPAGATSWGALPSQQQQQLQGLGVWA